MESDLTKEFTDKLVTCNAMVKPIVGNMYGHNGMPDRVIISKHWHGFIEFKELGKRKLTKLQARTLRDMCDQVPGVAVAIYLSVNNIATILFWVPGYMRWMFVDVAWKTMTGKQLFDVISRLNRGEMIKGQFGVVAFGLVEMETLKLLIEQ